MERLELPVLPRFFQAGGNWKLIRSVLFPESLPCVGGRPGERIPLIFESKNGDKN